jgi:exodeoxyribonuclease-5
MYLDQITSATPGTALIARSSLAASQWEAALAEPLLERSERAWASPLLSTLPQWLADRWERGRLSGSSAHERCVLSTAQSMRLWQRVIEESPEGAELISPAHVAGWAALARQTLLDLGLAGGGSLEAGDSDDIAAFERWNRRFDAALDAAGWIDPASLLFRLNRLPVGNDATDILLLDPEPVDPPELRRLRDRWRSAGLGISSLVPEADHAIPRLLLAADAEDELRQAALWCERILGQNSHARVAVVVPALDALSADVERVFADRLGPGLVSNPVGSPLADSGIIGAALSMLLLLSPRADFGTLSRWLRSPFFGSSDDDRQRQAAALECRLRSDGGSQQGFLYAYRSQGLRAELQRRLPDAAAGLDAVLDRLPRRATLSRWVEIWQAGLKTLGWRGITSGLAEPLADAWDRTLAGVAELTPVTPALDLPAALDELDQVVARQAIRLPPGLRGVHLLRRVSEIGPGFAGAWVTGMTEQGWPEPPRPNPLVPWSLQLANGMPAARPGAALAMGVLELERLGRRVPDLVLSCPVRVLDQPQVPHPRFHGWSASAAEPSRTASRPTFASSRIGARAQETFRDHAPALQGRHVPGGARTLDLQATCPLKAFVEARLGARALEPAQRGIDGRLRGVLLHRALELLHRPGMSTAADTAVENAAAAAAAELLPSGDAWWQAQAWAEQRRVRRLMTAWLELESQRTSFETIAVERRTEIEIDGWTLGARIDRIDCVAGGAELLLDYKTGSNPPRGWRDERLADCQLPLYAQRTGPEVGAIVVATLNDDGVSYRALGPQATGFPGKHADLDARDWHAQQERWRVQLLDLIREFAAGDTRIPGTGSGLERTLWAALARSARLAR